MKNLLSVCFIFCFLNFGILAQPGQTSVSVDENIERFFTAAREGDGDFLLEFIKGVDTDELDAREYGSLYTALMLASQGGHIDAVEILIDAGVNVDGSHMIFRDNSTNQIIREGKKELDIPSSIPKAEETIEGNKINEIVQSFSTEKRTTTDNMTPLMLAVREGHLYVTQALIFANADIHARNREGQTALMFAREGGHIDIEDFLILSGATY